MKNKKISDLVDEFSNRVNIFEKYMEICRKFSVYAIRDAIWKQHQISLLVTSESFLDFDNTGFYKITKIRNDSMTINGPVLFCDDNANEIMMAHEEQTLKMTTLKICEEGEYSVGVDANIAAFMSRLHDVLQVTKIHAMVSIALLCSENRMPACLRLNPNQTSDPPKIEL